MKPMMKYAEQIYNATVTARCGDLYINEAIDLLADKLRNASRVFFVGNGGSIAACAHMANDLCLAGVNACDLGSSANITCIGNDFGFDKVFTKQLEWWANNSNNNVLIALSCSGNSKNVLDAVDYAKSKSFSVITFSGFHPDNKLAAAGHMNFYVPSNSYGIVQLAHEALLHCAIDKLAGLY